jgi:hypothetical protein
MRAAPAVAAGDAAYLVVWTHGKREATDPAVYGARVGIDGRLLDPYGILCLAALTCVWPATAQVVKVACVGDSITEGAGVDNPGVNAYPVVLGRLLGTNYQTRNFGVSLPVTCET